MNDLPIHDIHLPAAVSWWPPAIGWWLLPVILLLLGLIIFKLIQFKKQYKPPPAYKRIALQEIKLLEKKFKDDDNASEFLRAISALLRRVALSYLPRESIAGLTGKQWINQLNKLAGKTVFTPEISALLINAPYQSHITFNQKDLLCADLLKACKQLIELLPEQPQEHAFYKNLPARGVDV